MIRTASLAFALILAPPAIAAKAQATGPSELIEAFLAAQRAFDQTTLGRLTAPDYVEISPLGEVDSRDRMLGFYAPDRKQATPEITVSERTVRVLGDTALVTARLGLGQRAMRAVYVARRGKGGWRLVSAQFTPMRAAQLQPQTR